MSVLKLVLRIKLSISLWCCYGMYVGVSFTQYKFVACNVYQFMEEMEYKWQLYPAVNSSAIVPNVCSSMLLWYHKFSLECPQHTPIARPWGWTYEFNLCAVYIFLSHQLCFNPFVAKIFGGNIKHIFTFYLIPPHWYDTGRWNSSSNKKWTYPFHIVNIMATGVLATQREQNISSYDSEIVKPRLLGPRKLRVNSSWLYLCIQIYNGFLPHIHPDQCCFAQLWS